MIFQWIFLIHRNVKLTSCRAPAGSPFLIHIDIKSHNRIHILSLGQALIFVSGIALIEFLRTLYRWNQYSLPFTIHVLSFVMLIEFPELCGGTHSTLCIPRSTPHPFPHALLSRFNTQTGLSTREKRQSKQLLFREFITRKFSERFYI